VKAMSSSFDWRFADNRVLTIIHIIKMTKWVLTVVYYQWSTSLKLSMY
jgi:hypothetical protein